MGEEQFDLGLREPIEASSLWDDVSDELVVPFAGGLVGGPVGVREERPHAPSLPLSIGKIESDYKFLYADIGLLSASFSYDEIKAIIRGSLGINKGYLYEAAIGETLRKNGVKTYYFGKSSGLKVDYVISYKGNTTLIEAKSKTGNAKSSKTIMNDPGHYGKT